jgi:heme/copper-type cytochrome/quinol oxidase subunit 2
MLTYTTFAIVILTSIWAGVDSHRLQISSTNKPYSWNNGFLSWLLCCLLLWIIAFPVYLFKRAKTLKERGTQSSSSTLTSLLGALAVIAVLLCIAAPFLGWQRLSVDELRDQVSTSIQNTWRNNPTTQNVRLKSLSLVHRNGNEYSGLVVADVSGKEEQHSVEVTYDGMNFMWKIQ